MSDNKLSPDELQMQQFARSRIYRMLSNGFRLLTSVACCYSSRDKKLSRFSFDKTKEFIFHWMNRDLQLANLPLPPIRYRERLFQTFTELAENQARFPLTEEAPADCPVCGTRLTTAYYTPLVCEHCMQPVLDALDELVRAAATKWTPEQLRESYLEWLKDVQKYNK